MSIFFDPIPNLWLPRNFLALTKSELHVNVRLIPFGICQNRRMVKKHKNVHEMGRHGSKIKFNHCVLHHFSRRASWWRPFWSKKCKNAKMFTKWVAMARKPGLTIAFCIIFRGAPHGDARLGQDPLFLMNYENMFFCNVFAFFLIFSL